MAKKRIYSNTAGSGLTAVDGATALENYHVPVDTGSGEAKEAPVPEFRSVFQHSDNTVLLKSEDKKGLAFLGNTHMRNLLPDAGVAGTDIFIPLGISSGDSYGDKVSSFGKVDFFATDTSNAGYVVSAEFQLNSTTGVLTGSCGSIQTKYSKGLVLTRGLITIGTDIFYGIRITATVALTAHRISYIGLGTNMIAEATTAPTAWEELAQLNSPIIHNQIDGIEQGYVPDYIIYDNDSLTALQDITDGSVQRVAVLPGTYSFNNATSSTGLNFDAIGIQSIVCIGGEATISSTDSSTNGVLYRPFSSSVDQSNSAIYYTQGVHVGGSLGVGFNGIDNIGAGTKSMNNSDYGFVLCHNMGNNCSAVANGDGGFTNCDNIGAYATATDNTSYGFSACRNIGAFATATGGVTGFNGCKNIGPYPTATGCSIAGFQGCDEIGAHSVVHTNTADFNDCEFIGPKYSSGAIFTGTNSTYSPQSIPAT